MESFSDSEGSSTESLSVQKQGFGGFLGIFSGKKTTRNKQNKFFYLLSQACLSDLEGEEYWKSFLKNLDEIKKPNDIANKSKNSTSAPPKEPTNPSSPNSTKEKFIKAKQKEGPLQEQMQRLIFHETAA